MALSTDTTLKGDGFNFNVRSMKFERTIDFGEFNFAASTNYELGDLPAGFVPRNLAILVLKKQKTGDGYDASAATLTLKIKSSEATITSTAVGGDSAANAYKLMTEAATTASGSTTLTYTTTLSTVAQGGTICAVVNNAATNGKVKVVIAGDMMTDIWDDGAKRDAFDPSEAIPDTKVS